MRVERIKSTKCGGEIQFDVTSLFQSREPSSISGIPKVHTYYSSSRSGLPHTGRSLPQLVVSLPSAGQYKLQRGNQVLRITKSLTGPDKGKPNEHDVHTTLQLRCFASLHMIVSLWFLAAVASSFVATVRWLFPAVTTLLYILRPIPPRSCAFDSESSSQTRSILLVAESIPTVGP